MKLSERIQDTVDDTGPHFRTAIVQCRTLNIWQNHAESLERTASRHRFFTFIFASIALGLLFALLWIGAHRPIPPQPLRLTGDAEQLSNIQARPPEVYEL